MSATLTLPRTRSAATLPATAANQSVVNNAVLQDISVDSDMLLRGKKSIAIVHNGAVYRLQATKLGKLILTK